MLVKSLDACLPVQEVVGGTGVVGTNNPKNITQVAAIADKAAGEGRMGNWHCKLPFSYSGGVSGRWRGASPARIPNFCSLTDTNRSHCTCGLSADHG